MSTDTTEAATGAAPPAWPTGISGTNHSNKPTEKRGANSGNSQQPQQIEAATHSPGNTSPTPPAAEAQPPVAESSAAANPAPKTADAAAVAAAGVVAQYSAENVFKYTSGKSGALSLEKLQEMTLQERAKYAADMMQQQQQQQIIATLRAKATSIEVRADILIHPFYSIQSLSYSICLIYFVRRLWNHVFTCKQIYL